MCFLAFERIVGKIWKLGSVASCVFSRIGVLTWKDVSAHVAVGVLVWVDLGFAQMRHGVENKAMGLVS